MLSIEILLTQKMFRMVLLQIVSYYLYSDHVLLKRTEWGQDDYVSVVNGIDSTQNGKNVFYVMLYNGRFKTRFKPIVHCHSENRSVNTKVKFTNRVIVKINNRNYFYDVSLIGYDYLLINFNRNKGGYKILDPFIPISRFTAQCNSRFQH